MFAHGETVTVLTAGSVTDPYSGDPAASWADATEFDVLGCAVADGGSVEPAQDARTAVDSDFDVIMPGDTEIGAHNRVVVRGLVCEVVGRPFVWRNPFTGWEPGLLVRVKIREG